MRFWFFLLLSLFVGEAVAASASDFGTVGLIDMPSARMQDDSAFTVAYARQPVADTFSFNYQAFPWLETSFRYIIQDPRNAFNAAPGSPIRDRSYGVKLRLREESQYFPSMALGLQDVVGTGVYSGEYLVGSKQLSDNIDLTLGIGWGRLSGSGLFSNPLRAIGSNFDVRSATASSSAAVGRTGTPSVGEYFSGLKVGAFGGVQYQLPAENFSLLLEYNPDNYSQEELRGNFIDKSSPFSFGVNWQPAEGIELGLSWQHGSELGLRFAVTSLSNAKPARRRNLAPYYRLKRMAGDEEALQAKHWYEKLAIAVQDNGLKLHAASLNKNQSTAYLEIENSGYMLISEAMAIIAKMAIPFLPESVSKISISLYETGLYPITVEIPVSVLQTSSAQLANNAAIHRKLSVLPGARLQNADYRSRKDLRKITIGTGVGNKISLFDPDVPLLYQVFLNVGTSIRLPWNTRLYAAKHIDLDNNYNRATRVSNSVLPHVRSDNLQYLKQGKNGIDRLYLNKYGKLAPSTYYRAFAGILEGMFAGVGGEVLHQPYRSRFAYGLSAIAVKQREFEQRFGFKNYDTIIGHASIYWATPFYNYDVAVHLGRYLAKDLGATFELKRTFSNGWQIGLFATLTDVPFDEFGEGSFDKGFVIRIPLESMSSKSSRGIFGSDIRPIGRDGGARLDGYSASLWDKLRSSNYDSVYDNLNEFLR